MRLAGCPVLDPLIALVVAANIVQTGVRLLRNTAHGLLMRRSPEDQEAISKILLRYEERSPVPRPAHAGLWAAPVHLDARPLVPGR